MRKSNRIRVRMRRILIAAGPARCSPIPLARSQASTAQFEPRFDASAAASMGIVLLSVAASAAYWWGVVVPSERASLGRSKRRGAVKAYLDELQGDEGRVAERWFYTDWLDQKRWVVWHRSDSIRRGLYRSAGQVSPLHIPPQRNTNLFLPLKGKPPPSFLSKEYRPPLPLSQLPIGPFSFHSRAWVPVHGFERLVTAPLQLHSSPLQRERGQGGGFQAIKGVFWREGCRGVFERSARKRSEQKGGGGRVHDGGPGVEVRKRRAGFW